MNGIHLMLAAISGLLILLHQPCLVRAVSAADGHTSDGYQAKRRHAVQDFDDSAYDENVRQALHQNVNNRPLEKPRILMRESASHDPAVSASVIEPRPIRIRFDYANMGDEDEDPFRTALVEHVLPSAAAEIARRISVKVPVDGTLYILPTCVEYFNNDRFRCTKIATTCNNLKVQEKYFSGYELCEGDSDESCATVPAQEGAADADIVIYVKANYDNLDSPCGVAATGGPCSLDPYTLRLVCGSLEFLMQCWDSMSEEEWRSPLSVNAAVHEILHAIYFLGVLGDYFIDENGQRLGAGNVQSEDSQGRQVYITPKVLEVSKEHYGCTELEGVPCSADYNHWDRYYQPRDVQKNFIAPHDIFSSLTLALAEDSGWYEANWELAAALPPVHKSTCDLFDLSCEDYASTERGIKDVCLAEEPSLFASCSSDHHFIKRCDGDTGETCRERAIDWNVLVDMDSAEFARGECTNTGHQAVVEGYNGNSFTSSSRCMESVGVLNWRQDSFDDSVSTSDPRCVEMQCTPDGTLQVVFDGTAIDCPTGDSIDVSDMRTTGERSGEFLPGSFLGPCPDNEQICSDLKSDSCSSNCIGGQGVCVDGTCQCHLGFSGSDCSERTCLENSCDEGQTCDLISGLCQAPATPAPTAAPETCCEDIEEQYNVKLFKSDSVCVSTRLGGEECQKSVEYTEAKGECESAGARLCTLAELQAKVAMGVAQLVTDRDPPHGKVGCGIGSLKVWTSTACQNKRGTDGFQVAVAANGRTAKCRPPGHLSSKYGMICCASTCSA